MAYDPNVLRRASARLEEEKRRREDERELLRRQTYAREPRLAQLDRRLQGTMAELVAASLRKGENAGDVRRAGTAGGSPVPVRRAPSQTGGAGGAAGPHGSGGGRPG